MPSCGSSSSLAFCILKIRMVCLECRLSLYGPEDPESVVSAAGCPAAIVKISLDRVV